MRDWDAGERRRADARGNARHNLEGDAMTKEKLGLLGPSSEDQRIAPLEPDNHPPGRCMLEQDLIDLVLVERAMPARLALRRSARALALARSSNRELARWS